MRYAIPSLEKFLKNAKPWGLTRGYWGGNWHNNFQHYDVQRTDPSVKGLLGQVGLKKGQKVLCVAGHRATWALALAKSGAKITYSELSQEITNYVSKNVKHKNIEDYVCASYVLFPSIPHQFDWTFTFEAVGPRPFIFFRSLLNNIGGKYVIWDNDSHAQKKLHQTLKYLNFCKKNYSATGNISTKNILSKLRLGEKAKHKHFIVTIKTQKKAREKMSLDLGLFEFFYKRKIASLDELSIIFYCSNNDIKSSLKRLSHWTALFDEKFSKYIDLK